MSKVNTTNVSKAPPATQSSVLAADVNSKFSAIATATTTVNNENIRSEGIDIRQISTTSPIVNRAVYAYNKWDDGTTNSYTIGTGAGGSIKTNMGGRAAVLMNHGIGATARLYFGNSTPLVLNQGDILRFHYSFNLHDIVLNGINAAFPIDSVNPDRDAIIFFPVYHDTPSTTPNNMANAKIFPNRVVWWDSDHTIPISIPQTDPPSASNNNAEKLLDDGIVVHDMAAENITLNVSTRPMRRLHGCLNYVHESATPLTIYQLSVCATPILQFKHYTGPGYDTRCWIVSSTDSTPNYPLTLKMERANLSAIALRKGAR